MILSVPLWNKNKLVTIRFKKKKVVKCGSYKTAVESTGPGMEGFVQGVKRNGTRNGKSKAYWSEGR